MPIMHVVTRIIILGYHLCLAATSGGGSSPLHQLFSYCSHFGDNSFPGDFSMADNGTTQRYFCAIRDLSTKELPNGQAVTITYTFGTTA